MGNMEQIELDIKPANISAAKRDYEDRGERIDVMAPLVLSATSRHRPALGDLVLELAAASAGLRRCLPEAVSKAVAELIRTTEAHYSLRLAGGEIHPVRIAQVSGAGQGPGEDIRNLEFEARALVSVQAWMDESGTGGPAASAQTLLGVHARYYAQLPEVLRFIDDPAAQALVPIPPGALRRRDAPTVRPRHVSLSPGAVPRFLAFFESGYCGLGRSETILAVPAAYHRLSWIQPFPAANGRLNRLVTRAMLDEALESGGLWSLSRGLVRHADEVRRCLANCDLPSRQGRDGSEGLSEEALAEFTRVFLTACLEEVEFMTRLLHPDELRTRLRLWTNERISLGALHEKSGRVVEAILARGELPRAEVPGLLDVSARSASRIVSGLVEHRVVVSPTSRAPLRLGFPATLAGRWLPGLFSDRT